MRKLVVILLLLITFSLVGCDLFENEGNILNYVGTYVLDGATETKYHIAYGNKQLISRENVFNTSYTVVIKSDKTVTVTDTEGKVYNGKIKCLEKYCRFYSTPFSSSYKFYLRYDGTLYYDYESSHASVEYDVTFINITLKKQSK